MGRSPLRVAQYFATSNECVRIVPARSRKVPCCPLTYILLDEFQMDAQSCAIHCDPKPSSQGTKLYKTDFIMQVIGKKTSTNSAQIVLSLPFVTRSETISVHGAINRQNALQVIHLVLEQFR